MNIQTEVALKDKNTLAIASVAEFYAAPNSLESFEEARRFACEKALPIKVLGGGSNVVMADRVQGVVVSYEDTSISVLEETSSDVLVEVGAGYVWHDFVMDSLEKGWFGLENLALIPGTVGAAPVQNIGAYGVEVEQFIEVVNGRYLNSGEAFRFTADQCDFSYRESCFKHELDGQVLITSVIFRLKKTPEVQIGYAPLNAMAEESGVPSPKTLAQWVIEVRQSKLPDPDDLPNAGSFFKNPVISQAEFNRLKSEYPDIPSYPQPEGVKVPAGWLIDQMGYKGKAFFDGSVSVHKNQALVLVNNGGSGLQVIEAAEQIKAKVCSVYGIQLEQEPRLFG